MDREDLSIGDWIQIETLEGKKLFYRIIDIRDDEVYTKIGTMKIENIKPVLLTPGILEIFGVEATNPKYLKESYTRYGKCWGIYDLDSVIQLVPDWREQPSYHVGIRYTDSPDPKDEGVVYTFMYEIKYLHQLQGLLKLLKNGNSFSGVTSIMRALKDDNTLNNYREVWE